MSQVIVDQNLRHRLKGLTEQVEFFDESGNPLGQFLPENVYRQLLRQLDQCPYTEAELTRFQQEKGGRPLADVWKSLRAE
jgi:hypothetical protein